MNHNVQNGSHHTEGANQPPFGMTIIVIVSLKGKKNKTFSDIIQTVSSSIVLICFVRLLGFSYVPMGNAIVMSTQPQSKNMTMIPNQKGND